MFTSVAISGNAALEILQTPRNPLLPRRGADTNIELPLKPLEAR